MKKTAQNRKRGGRIFITALISALSLTLGGCSLAREDAGEDAKDTLIGVLITTKHLEDFDTAWVEDNAFGLLKSSDITINNADKFTNLLYADIDKNGSDDIADWDISFRGVNGMQFLAPIWKDGNGTRGYSSHTDDGICGPYVSLNQSDDAESIEMSATIYNLPKPGENFPIFHINRVYQTAGGKIYTTSGSAVSSDFSSDERDIMSTTISDEAKSVAGGKTTTERAEITIRVATMHEPVKITLFEMGDGNNILRQAEYAPGKLPEQLAIGKDTAYIIAETEKKAPDGTVHADRLLYSRQDADNEEPLKTFYVLKDTILAEQYTTVTWEE